MEVDTPAGREEDGQPPSHPSTLISTEQLNPADLLPWVEAGRVSRNYHLQLPKVVPWIKKNFKSQRFHLTVNCSCHPEWHRQTCAQETRAEQEGGREMVRDLNY